mmetsp:Transcript_12068/g.26321  ORF Transcript_12068/g.26321 Transcript_12068/m.26321 type:complete len:252 (-) Transcript_12068:1090-1845(-)
MPARRADQRPHLLPRLPHGAGVGLPPEEGRHQDQPDHGGRGAADHGAVQGPQHPGALHRLHGALHIRHEAREDLHRLEHAGRRAQGASGQAPHPRRPEHAHRGRPRPGEVAVPEVRRADRAPRRLHDGQGRQRRRADGVRHEGRERRLGLAGRRHGPGGRRHVPHRRVRQDERPGPHVAPRGHGAADGYPGQSRNPHSAQHPLQCARCEQPDQKHLGPQTPHPQEYCFARFADQQVRLTVRDSGRSKHGNR